MGGGTFRAMRPGTAVGVGTVRAGRCPMRPVASRIAQLCGLLALGRALPESTPLLVDSVVFFAVAIRPSVPILARHLPKPKRSFAIALVALFAATKTV